jgi:hypothetical protein
MARKPKNVEVAEPTEVVEAAAEVIAAARNRGPRGTVEAAVITVLRDVNPKRAGSQAAADFDNYRTGMTVGEFVDLVGKRATPNLVYDAAHGFIAIEGYNPDLIIAKEKAPKAEKVAKEPKAPKAKKAKKEAAVVEDADAALEVQEELL